MTFISPSRPQTSTHFFPASFALFVSGFLSVLHVNFPAPIGSVSFLLLPLLIVALWPSGVNAVVTIISLCLMGILMDWGTNGALGQWTLIFLAVFAVLRPDLRENHVSFLGAIVLWIIGLVIGVIMLVVTGWLVYGILPNFMVLLKQACLVSLTLPLLILIRNMTRYLLTDASDRQY